MVDHDEFPDNFLPGAVFDKPDERDHDIDMGKMGMGSGALPASFSVHKAPLNWKPNAAGAFNQGQVGSCTTNAIAQLYLYELQRQGVHYGDYVPSRLFLYYIARYGAAQNPTTTPSAKFYDALRQPANTPRGDVAKDTGSNSRDVIKIMRALGAPPEDKDAASHVAGSGKWPYDEKVAPDQTTRLFKPTDWPARAPEPQCYAAAALHQSLGYARPDARSPDCWKRCIQRGYPIVFGYKVYDSWWAWGNSGRGKGDGSIAPIPRAGEGYGGRRHAVIALGWDDAKKAAGSSSKGAFYVQNSWSPTWGDNGFFWMPYEWLAWNDGETTWPWAVESPWTFMQVK